MRGVNNFSPTCPGDSLCEGELVYRLSQQSRWKLSINLAVESKKNRLDPGLWKRLFAKMRSVDANEPLRSRSIFSAGTPGD